MTDAVTSARLERAPIRALLVDPSLFTAPYDAALTQGLLAAGVQPMWATRPIRRGDDQEIPARYTDPFFYRRVDDLPGLPRPLRALAKGAAHAVGLLRLLYRVWTGKPDVVHVQWVVLPPLDVAALWLIRMRTRYVLTVHDTVPFNGIRASVLQNLGFDLPIRIADAVIVHTRAGKDRLIARGIEADKIAVIPHGPLQMQARPTRPRAGSDGRWTFVLFGEIKEYKGLDLIVEALGRLRGDIRDRCRVIVAGRPRMDVSDIQRRIDQLGLRESIELRLHRHSMQEMADLFDAADTFVFPYRQVDASGVYFLVKGLGKWLIASRVGVFAEDMRESLDGELISPSNVEALAAAIERAARHRPQGAGTRAADTWEAIGRSTRALYVGNASSAGAAQAVA
ncbi:MAG: glycosyltransferase [Burkholderiaceae bacterium]